MKIILNRFFYLSLLVTIVFMSTYARGQSVTVYTYTSDTEFPLLVDYVSLFHTYDRENVKEGIDATFNLRTTSDEEKKIEVRIYDYDSAKPNKKGKEIYYIYATPTSPNNSYNLQMEYEDSTYEVMTNNMGDDEVVIAHASSNDLKKRAQSVAAVRPGFTFIDGLKSVLFGTGPSGVQPVIIEVKTYGVNTEFARAYIPGVGEISISEGDDDKVIGQEFGTFFTYCQDPNNRSRQLCELFDRLRHPDSSSNESEDIFIAAHRGWWGYDEDAPSENSLGAITSANNQNMKIMEMDITMSVDQHLVFMHDYVLSRLTNYSGSDYSFEMASETMQKYYTRKRDGSVSNEKLSKFSQVIDYVYRNNMIMMVDVKELQSDGTGDDCRANCGFQSYEEKKKSWIKIVNSCIRQAESYEEKTGNGVRKNLIFKTYYQHDSIKKFIGPKMNHVLWTPIIVPNNFKNVQDGQPSIDKMIEFIDDWDKNGSTIIACFETNFFPASDVMLQSFTRHGTVYDNLLHYIHATTGRRSGIFSEEPVGPKGTVNRWGKWNIKDGFKDIRGDFFKLMEIPYGKYMLITTDRIDVWKEIKSKY